MSVNEDLANEAVRHAVDLQRYSNGVVRRMIALLNRADNDLLTQIESALQRLPANSFTISRLEEVLFAARNTNIAAYRWMELDLPGELKELARYEAGYQHRAMTTVIPDAVLASVTVANISAEQVYTAALSRPFQGGLLSDWAKKLPPDRMTKVRNAIRLGYVENQSISQIMRRLRGTRARQYKDGILDIGRREAEIITRTAVGHMAAFTRDRFYEANTDVVKAVQWLSTLDTRTTEICRARSGKRYTADTHKPIGHQMPWRNGPGRAHFGCRSTATPVTKSFRELGLDIDDFSPSTQSSMDGQVPADLNFNQWLSKQSAARQDDVLGPVRGRLFRQGKIPMERFYNRKGEFLTLDELKARDSEAFARAGVSA